MIVEDDRMDITIFRFEFKDKVDGQNPFDSICNEIGLNPKQIESITFYSPEVGFETNNGKEETVAIPVPRKPKKAWRPKNSWKKSKAYNLWITKDDLEKVKQSIVHVEFGYVPTTEVIVKRTGLSLERVRATLRLMREEGMLKTKRNEKLQCVHELIE